MTEPISRRSAIRRMLAAISSVKLLSWEESRHSKVPWPAQLTEIVPGERFGQIYLDMEPANVVACLGSPCEIKKFEAEKLEQTLNVFAYINKMTGSNLTAKDAFPLRPATTHFNYDRFGLSLCFEKDRVSAIFAYTGVLSGYDDRIKNCFAGGRIPSDAVPLRTLSDVRARFGKPNGESPLKHAPIPEEKIYYAHGIAFAGRADDDRLSQIVVMHSKVSYR